MYVHPSNLFLEGPYIMGSYPVFLSPESFLSVSSQGAVVLLIVIAGYLISSRIFFSIKTMIGKYRYEKRVWNALFSSGEDIIAELDAPSSIGKEKREIEILKAQLSKQEKYISCLEEQRSHWQTVAESNIASLEREDFWFFEHNKAKIALLSLKLENRALKKE